MADAPITFFIPLGGERYQNAGLTVRAENVNELIGVLADLNDTNEAEESKLSVLLNDVATIRAGVELVFPAPVAATATKVTHPQASSNNGDAPSCAHGVMKWKEGTSKAGKAYKGWFCSAPYGQQQCDARFVR